ncbi:Nucleosome-remodeling factor subunit [Armadillidium nasatum]|uniref:Nucleosome-remodeling factor subunit n=1 Tax=Armadillidium nasatum TaxID=96803 RepID=A0A5N5SJC0_9CRUS|nr:Nucleosome-remodeling factor subunit [Armadillidium nasatum]
MNYTNSEMCDMHFVYGRANGNSLAAMRLYEEMYPNRVIPHHTMFARLHQRLGETGSFKKLTNGNGRPRTVSTPDVEEQVLQELEDSPTTSKQYSFSAIKIRLIIYHYEIKSQKDKKESENDHHVDVENDSESSASDDNNNNNNNDGVDEDETVEENIEEIPDSQRRVTIHKRRPAGHLLKEMRMHKFKYEALDKMDEMYPCYSPSCRNGRRSSCYSPSCIIKMKTKQKLVNSVSNYKIITSKPAPFDNIGSCSPVRLNEENEADSGKKSETAYNSQSLSKTMASNGQITQLPASVEDKEKSFSKLPLDEDSSHSQGSYSSDQKTNCKGEKVFSSENTSGKIYLKKSTEIKKQKKHKIPPINYFRVMKLWKKEEDNSKPQINKRSLFILPSWELSIMARKGGKYCPNGFNLNAKVNHHFWPYPCPRPVFKITWLYRTTLVNSINAVAYQLRVLWTCLKWDEMHEKGPADGRKQITTDIEIIQTEILKRKITGRFLEKTNYLRRKVVIPLDVPKPVREFTPSQRSGLRKRRRAQSPINQQPQSSEEWVEEDKVDLWEIKFFGERLEKAATLSKKSEKGDSSFSAISRSTSPAEFKARMEEQLKIQRANFNQKKSIENQSNASSNKGIVKVAIGSAVTGNGSGSKLTFTNSGRLIQTPSIVTMGSKLPSVLAGKKIVTTKGGKIITVQTSGGGLTLGSQQSDNSKLSVNKSSIFPVSSLPKVQVTPQGNKVIKLQNMNTCGQRTILPRVVSSQNNSQTSIIRPFTTSTSTSQNFQPIATSTPVSGVRPVVASQQIQIFRMPDGQFQVKGLQEGQQLLQRGDGKLQVVNTKIAGSPVTSNVSSNSIQVTQQTKPLSVTGKDTQVRGIAPLSGNQILRINGQQVILRTSSTAPNGKSVTSISAKDTSLAGGNVSIPKFKPLEEQNPKVSPIGQNQINSNSLLKTQSANSSPLLKNQPATNVSEEKSKMSLSSTPPSSPTKGAASTTPGVTNTMTLRVQVRMTEQGPKTIIQGLQPDNLQVNQLSPLMTLTLQSTNKSQQQSSKAGNTVQQTSLPSPTPVNSLLKSAISSETSTIPEKEKAVDILGVKDLTSDLKENSQTIQTALNKNDLTPDVEEKLLQLQKLTKTKKSPQDGNSIRKRLEKIERGEWDTSDVTPSKAKSNKRAKSEKKLKKDGLSSPSPISAVTSPTSATPVVAVANTYAGSKTIHQDARKKLARQQRLEAMLGKHKDLLKKDILKKRALLEKELQLQIHKELSLARQQLHTFEKLKNVESVSSPPAKKPKQEPVATPVSHNVTPSKETIKTKKGEPHPPTIMSTSGSSTLKINPKTSAASRVNKKSNKTKSKKIVCICRTFFDDTKFYVGCDLCGNWFHGDCVGITETLSRSMTEYVCDDCANAKLNKDLFCFCRQPYDETQFYICCEKCEDWYHGKCIGIMQAEADDIDDYICPKCEPDNKWNRPCQKKLTDKDYTELKKVAKLLIQHKNAWPFLEPVDQSEVPDYYKVVKQPMDLKAVERKVQQRKYKNLFEFVGDVMLVFDNCRAYNPPNSSFFSCANNLEGFFCMKLKQLKSKIGQKS